jgi:hypothetical protein
MPVVHGSPFTGTAQVVSLKVRPSQISHLCFEAGGILGEMNTQLGASVTAFPFSNLYTAMSSNSGSTDPSLLHYNAANIQSYVNTNLLASLRAEGTKTALSKAINARQNAWYSKYGHQHDIITQMTSSYDPSVTDSKPYRLGQLQKLAMDQVVKLKEAYDSDPIRKLTSPSKGVVQSTTSKLNSTATGQSAEVDDDVIGFGTGNKAPIDPPPAGAQFQTIEIVNANQENIDYDEGTSQVKTDENVANTDYAFRIPYYEAEAQYQRAQISLIDQQFAQYISSLNFKNLPQVFTNELNNIDGDVYRLQVAYANTLLMSPITGIVTGIYKYPGDPVRAGEPVLRIENNQSIFLVGTIIYQYPITPNVSTAQITTTIFGNPDSPQLYPAGTVVAARGHGQENKWDVIILCNQNPSLYYPPGYSFDFDDTTLTITN